MLSIGNLLGCRPLGCSIHRNNWTRSRYCDSGRFCPWRLQGRHLSDRAAFPVGRVEYRERELSHEVLNPRPDCPTLRVLIWSLTFLPVSQRVRSDSFGDSWETNAFYTAQTGNVTLYCICKDFRWKNVYINWSNTQVSFSSRPVAKHDLSVLVLQALWLSVESSLRSFRIYSCVVWQGTFETI
jgi:hypothetical protein